MVSLEELLPNVKIREPIGVGLITLNPNAPGPTLVIEVENPRFMHPLPVKFDYPIVRLLSCPFEIIESVIEELKAVPVAGMNFWWSYAIYE